MPHPALFATAFFAGAFFAPRARAEGSALRGSAVDARPDAYAGFGIRLNGHTNVTIRGARISGFKRALWANRADGLLVEMHPSPCDAWCDADQALAPQELKSLMGTLGAIAGAIGRTL